MDKTQTDPKGNLKVCTVKKIVCCPQDQDHSDGSKRH